MVEIYSQDRAIGEHAKTIYEIKQKCIVSVEDGNIDFIDDVDNMIFYNEISLENDCAMENEDDDQNMVDTNDCNMRIESSSHYASSSKSSKEKNKVSPNGNELEFIRDSLDIVDEAILKLTSKLLNVA
ncbi:unnamed protein product [Dovyalis caffra]|uniref:Uncharacterized protein n=1 Tax=Dovyalis caffra TaxID=77055 RepID=A0AAV1RMC5_9ROSI|nr:unnamed protein product [Dovyalis caffra]